MWIYLTVNLILITLWDNKYLYPSNISNDVTKAIEFRFKALLKYTYSFQRNGIKVCFSLRLTYDTGATGFAVRTFINYLTK